MKTYKEIRDIVYNNPRADKQAKGTWDDQKKKEIMDRMLYDDVRKRMKDAYQRNKRQAKIDKLQSNKSHWKGLS